VRYLSTRGEAPVLGFEDVLLTGLARDGGLYVPVEWPRLTPEDLDPMAGLAYAEAAGRIMLPFVNGEVPEPEFLALVRAAYATFAHDAVCPLVQIGPNDWVLELFYGPTLAFKDIAMQVLGPLMDRTLRKRGARATIVGATSGDTGSAAIEAFKGRETIDIFILHPMGRTSDVQRKQMTTAVEENVHNIAIEGTFDDCQALVKAMFNDLALRDQLQLAGVNSINWARLMPQIAYYVTSTLAVRHRGGARFSVPTGNFGDAFAGFAADRMGAAIERILIATNSNDILARAFLTGRYEPRVVVPTQSPSMDIQVSSNFERLIFEMSGRSPEAVRGCMADLTSNGSYLLPSHNALGNTELFLAATASESETTEAIASLYQLTGYVVDPHTAVGLAAQRRFSRETRENHSVPRITLATAHPAKFPDAIERAIGQRPEAPERLKRVLAGKERYTVLPKDYSVVSRYISERSRAGRRG
jgi:threonine synthase